MIRVLVVDDDTTKAGKIVAAIRATEGVAISSIDDARDLASAKRLLKQQSYDLMLLDIMLPATIDSALRPQGGLELLRELAARGQYYKMPRHIIGLTAYDEGIEAATDEFDASLLSLVRYDVESTGWRDALQRRVKLSYLAQQSAGSSTEFESHICIVTAMQSPELDAILALPWPWHSVTAHNDHTCYYEANIPLGAGTRRVLAASAPRMGMGSAAVLAMKMIQAFKPRYLAIAGIAAGIKGRCETGDVIAADPSWDWGSGKLHRDDGTPGFSASPHQIGLQARIRGVLDRIAQDDILSQSIRSQWRGDVPATVLKMRIGPMASGAAVVADNGVVEDMIKSQHRKLLGIEMETYGVFLAATEAPHPQPGVLSLKSVCDFADANKDDRWQRYAAYTSAMMMKAFVEFEDLPEP